MYLNIDYKYFFFFSIFSVIVVNMADPSNNIILFDVAKNEMFDINENLKILRRKLKGSYTIAT